MTSAPSKAEYAKSNANTFVRACDHIVFLTSCVGINLGDIHWGLRHPRDVPSVDPSTLGRKTLYELASFKCCSALKLSRANGTGNEQRQKVDERPK